MRKDLEEKVAGDGRTALACGRCQLSPMARGCEHGDGWFNIHWRLCVDLEPLVTEFEKQTGERFEVVQVKEKLGALRLYASHHTDALDGRIAEAQLESSRTCEVCGQPARRREAGGRVSTPATSTRKAPRSDEAAARRDRPVNPGGYLGKQAQEGGCRVRSTPEGRRWIAYCPTHAATPDLLKALRRAIAEATARMGDGGIRLETVGLAKVALAKVTARERPSVIRQAPRSNRQPRTELKR